MDSTTSPAETDALAAAVRAGDESAFATLFERHRRELHVHCYRMLGSFDDAEDVVQETFLRAWRKRESFRGLSSFRAWLYRIATNACLDVLDRRKRLAPPRGGTAAEVPWLQLYPDQLLEGVASGEDEPDAVAVEKETIELAFLVAIQHLPPRQRAVLIVRDVLGWPASDTAELLETSTASVNSSLQRARATMKEHLSPRRSEWTGPDPSAQERELLESFVTATESGDGDAIVELLRDDAGFTMPPQPMRVVGGREIVNAWIEGGFGSDEFGHLRCVLTRANRQPAVACYVLRSGDSVYRALAVDVLHIENGKVAEITAFGGERVFQALGLPPTLAT
jgi:RNA polymerase sigma-70 factor, ECF subfamily